MTIGDQPGDPGAGPTENPTTKFPQPEATAQGRTGPRQEGPSGYPQSGYAQGEYQQGSYQQGQAQPGPGGQPIQQWMATAAGRTANRVQSMPWQERMLRLPGAFAVLAGFFALVSCLFPWWSLFDRSGGTLVEYTVAPFRGISASSGSRWSDMAALNSLSQGDLSTVQSITVAVGIVIVIAALCMIAGGLLVARATMPVLGISLTVFGAVFLGYARVPSGILSNITDSASDLASALGGEMALFSDLVGSIMPESRFGAGLSTFALTLAVIGIVVYIGMIAYRETIRFRRWTA